MPFSRREQEASRHNEQEASRHYEVSGHRMDGRGPAQKSEEESLYDLRFGRDIQHIVDSLPSRPAHLFPDDLALQLRSRLFVADWVFAEGHSSKERGQFYNDRRACTLIARCTNGASVFLGGLEAAEEIIYYSEYDPWGPTQNTLADCRGDCSKGRWGSKYLQIERFSGHIISVGPFA